MEIEVREEKSEATEGAESSMENEGGSTSFALLVAVLPLVVLTFFGQVGLI